MAEDVSNFFTGALITSFLGAVLLLFEDFAGWYNRNSYVESWGYVYFTSGILSVIIIGSAAAALLFCSWVSYRALSTKQVDKKLVQKAFLASTGVFALAVVGALVFVVSMLLDEPSSWWLDTSFYAATLGSGLSALFFHLALKTPEK